MASELKMVAGEPAFILKDTLIIADLHLGIEAELDSEQIAESAILSAAECIDGLMQKSGAKHLIVLGDVGHRLPKANEIEWRLQPKINAIVRQLIDKHDAKFLSGNHDGSVNARMDDELIIGDIGFFHGHRWPSKELMNCKTIIAGHAHPVIVFRDTFGHRTWSKVWVKGRPTTAMLERYKLASGPEMVIMPAFRDYPGGGADISQGFLIQSGSSKPPFEKDMFKIETAYLLDGTEIDI